ESRQQILKISRSGREFRVVGSIDLLDMITHSLGSAEIEALGLGAADRDGRPILNIEGAAWHKGMLLLGLKQPRPDRGAIIWRLRTPGKLFGSGVLEKGQISVLGYADLRTPDGRAAGISDLLSAPDGELYALSTVPGAAGKGQEGGLHRLTVASDGTITSTVLCVFPGLKPEGLSLSPAGGLSIVVDGDDGPTYFTSIERPRS
ncbi:MAG: hypothetical protein WC889_17940, partial [Myxococcota bacterium]